MKFFLYSDFRSVSFPKSTLTIIRQKVRGYCWKGKLCDHCQSCLLSFLSF